jgi:hypothetical protein
VNPNALYQADKADHERRAKALGSLSGLHAVADSGISSIGGMIFFNEYKK